MRRWVGAVTVVLVLSGCFGSGATDRERWPDETASRPLATAAPIPSSKSESAEPSKTGPASGPYVDFTYHPWEPRAGELVEFQDATRVRPGDEIQSRRWDFGDGKRSDHASPRHAFNEPGTHRVTLVVTTAKGATNSTIVEVTVKPWEAGHVPAASADGMDGTAEPKAASTRFKPRVIVGVPDTGINPYHSIFHRPHLTSHPCTYIQGFPCSVKALPLSVGMDDYEAAYARDANVWASVTPDTWYWIPRTVFVAVSCRAPATDVCILDDGDMHGTGTTSSVIMENPDALIAFREGGGDVLPFIAAGLPVDVFSVSWGWVAPVPLFEGWKVRPIYVKAAGNDPRSTVVDGWSGDPEAISVGGAYAADGTEDAMASKQPEIVSYYCRPTAQTQSIHEMRPSYCGTSFAAPTAAGALSKVILALRRESGYLGGNEGPFVDPILGVTRGDLRDAMNRTASYAPEAKYPNQGGIWGVPLNPVMPCLQWGWGFYDGNVADATIGELVGTAAATPKSEACRTYMEAQFAAKATLNGPF